jgi:hypothetical protein
MRTQTSERLNCTKSQNWYLTLGEAVLRGQGTLRRKNEFINGRKKEKKHGKRK